MARAKYVVGFSLLCYLDIVFGVSHSCGMRAKKKVSAIRLLERNIRCLAIVVFFFLAFPCACLAIRIPSQKITKEFAKASKRTQTKQEKNLLRTSTSVVSI